MKNLDKEDLPWFGSEKYLSRKSEDKSRGFWGDFLPFSQIVTFLSFIFDISIRHRPCSVITELLLLAHSLSFCVHFVPRMCSRWICTRYFKVRLSKNLKTQEGGSTDCDKPEDCYRTARHIKRISPSGRGFETSPVEEKWLDTKKKKNNSVLIQRQEKSQSVCYKKEENTL